MAEGVKKAVIVLDDGKLLYVQSTIAQINSEIEKRKSLNLPVIPVVDERGREGLASGLTLTTSPRSTRTSRASPWSPSAADRRSSRGRGRPLDDVVAVCWKVLMTRSHAASASSARTITHIW
jgi:hypothetical protein